MGFLKDALKSGLSDGISKGIKDAVNSAVETAVKPAADRYADAAAKEINAAASAMNASAEELNEAAGTAADAGIDRASLSAGLNSYVSSMSSLATEFAKGFKECPNCGETCEADRKFCPNCGSALPETTIAEGLVCPKCGKQNTVGTKFCADCGTVLPMYREEVEQEMAERAALKAEEEKNREYEARKTALSSKANETADIFKDVTGDLRNKASEVGGQAVNSALDAAGSLFRKFRK